MTLDASDLLRTFALIACFVASLCDFAALSPPALESALRHSGTSTGTLDPPAYAACKPAN